MEIFQDYAYYYNVFYKDKDYKREALQVENLINTYSSKAHSIINFGCGTGKHDIELSKLGYECTGIDLSNTMIEIAKKNIENCDRKIDFSVADIRSYEAEKKYDVVISLFHVMSYQNSNEDVLSTFKCARNALQRDGLFIFDCWYGPGVLSDPPVVRVKEIEDENYQLVRVARPIMHDKKNVVDVCYEVFVINKLTNIVQKINETHSMRYFFRPELDFLLSQTGFKLLTNIDCNTLEDTGFDTWTSYFIAKAI